MARWQWRTGYMLVAAAGIVFLPSTKTSNGNPGGVLAHTTVQPVKSSSLKSHIHPPHEAFRAPCIGWVKNETRREILSYVGHMVMAKFRKEASTVVGTSEFNMNMHQAETVGSVTIADIFFFSFTSSELGSRVSFYRYV